jgi:hypothetical protein
MLFMSCLAAGWKARCMDAFYHSFSDEKLLQYGNMGMLGLLCTCAAGFLHSCRKVFSILKELYVIRLAKTFDV